MLHYFYGAMCSGKSLDMMRKRYNYLEVNCNILTFAIEHKGSHNTISSRAMKEKIIPDGLIQFNTDIFQLIESFDQSIGSLDAIFIDECQFLTIKQIRQLRDLSENCEIYCYGLLTTTENEMWGTAKELMLLAHEKQEIKSLCQKCGKRDASHHIKKYEGDQNDKSSYQSVCYECWREANENLFSLDKES